MKIIVASLLAFTLLTGGALAAFIGFAPQTEQSALTVPMTTIEVGATGAPSLYAINHATNQKWTVDQRGLTSETLKKVYKDHDCGGGFSARTQVD